MSKRRRFPLPPPAGGGKVRPAERTSPRDDADDFLNAEESVRNFERIGSEEAWVVARATMFPLYVTAPKTVTTQLTDKPQTVTLQIGGPDERIAQICQPPNGIIRYQFQVEDSDEARVFLTYMAARAVRNYLAYVLEIPVPMRLVLMARGMMIRENFDIDLMRYHRPEDETNPEGKAAFYADIQAAYPRTEQLLKRVDPTSPIGRAISSVGRAVWNEDDEDAFLAAWRGIDIVSKLDFKHAMEAVGHGVHELQAPYREAEQRMAAVGHPGRVSDLSKVQVTLGRRLGDVPPSRISELNELRGIIAHDVLDATRFRTIRSDKWNLIALARRAVESALKDPFGTSPPEVPRRDAAGAGR